MRTKTGSLNAEFAATLYVFFFLFVFPLLDLTYVAMAYVTQMFITNQACIAASLAGSPDISLSNMRDTTTNLSTGGFGRFVGMKPSGGYQNCGSTLYIVATNIANPNYSLGYGPNELALVPEPVKESDTIYEAVVKSDFVISPLLNLGFLPGLASIPCLGAPVTFNTTAHRAVETPETFGGSGQLAFLSGQNNTLSSTASGTTSAPQLAQFTQLPNGDSNATFSTIVTGSDGAIYQVNFDFKNWRQTSGGPNTWESNLSWSGSQIGGPANATSVSVQTSGTANSAASGIIAAGSAANPGGAMTGSVGHSNTTPGLGLDCISPTASNSAQQAVLSQAYAQFVAWANAASQ